MSGSASRISGNLSDGQRAPLLIALVGLAGVLAAAGVAYATAVNPAASPPGAWGPGIRVFDIAVFMGAGMYALVRHPEERLGRILLALGLFSSIWFLHGSSNPYLFTTALLVGIFALPAYNYLLLSFPEGHLHSALERRLTVGAGLVIALGWVPLRLISRQPVISVPFVHCAPHCPRNVLYLGAAPALRDPAQLLVRVGYTALAVGVVLILLSRLRRSSRLTRQMLGPVLVVSAASAAILALTAALGKAPSGPLRLDDWLLLVAVPAVPIALVVGLAREQLFLKRALEGLVGAMPGVQTPEQLRSLMTQTLRDDSLRLVLLGGDRNQYTDLAGSPVRLPPEGVRIRELEIPGQAADGDGTVAAMVFDARLADDPRFMRAVTAAAGMSLQRYRLEADLRRSRRRMIVAADRERERLERNLHDGAQQRLVSLRVRLALAAEAAAEDPSHAAELMTGLDAEIAEAIADLREVAHGLYPPLLARHGLERALDAVVARATQPTTISAEGIGRYPPETELAVYFCCLEALQNADKHAGAGAARAVRLWQGDSLLHFEVSDRGVGFDPQPRPEDSHHTEDHPYGGGTGLQNMSDRVGAIGGVVSLRSTVGQGTTVTGAVPVAAAREPKPAEDPERPSPASGDVSRSPRA